MSSLLSTIKKGLRTRTMNEKQQDHFNGTDDASDPKAATVTATETSTATATAVTEEVEASTQNNKADDSTEATNNNQDNTENSNGNGSRGDDYWQTEDFSSYDEDELQLVGGAAETIQLAYKMYVAKKAAKNSMPDVTCLHEWKVVSREELLGQLSNGKSVRIKVQPYFPQIGEEVTSVDGRGYLLVAPLGTKAATEEAKKKKAKYAAKRKIGALSASVVQMKDAKVRGKAASLVKSVKSLQKMQTYGNKELAKACPPSDTFLISRDSISIRPGEKPQGLQERKKEHWSILLPNKFKTQEKKKELGKYFLDLGNLMLAGGKAGSVARKEQLTISIHEDIYLESIYGPPVTKKTRREE